jgi:hypothetical protein
MDKQGLGFAAMNTPMVGLPPSAKRRAALELRVSFPPASSANEVPKGSQETQDRREMAVRSLNPAAQRPTGS